MSETIIYVSVIYCIMTNNIVYFVFLFFEGIKPPESSRRRPPQQVFEPASGGEPGTQRALIQQNFQNKLKEIEQLQYDLTKQVQ